MLSFRRIIRCSGILPDVHVKTVHRYIDVNREFLNYLASTFGNRYYSVTGERKNEKSEDWNYYSRKFYLPEPKNSAETYGRIHKFTGLLEDARIVKWMLLMCSEIDRYEKIFHDERHCNRRNPDNFVFDYQRAESFDFENHFSGKSAALRYYDNVNFREIELRRQLWSFYLDNPPIDYRHDVERLMKHVTDKKSFSRGVAKLRALCFAELYQFARRRFKYAVRDPRESKKDPEITDAIRVLMHDFELSPYVFEFEDGSVDYATII